MSGRTRGNGTERHVYCFVPSEDIEIVVLAAYLQSFIDGTATIKPSKHPRDRDRLGFTVGASSTLGREALEDLIQDSRDWEKEQNSREYEDRPYDYQDSDTWARRKRLGPSPARNTRVVEGRRVPANIPGRHDPNNPGTASEISYSTASSQPSSIFSRGSVDSRSLSTLSEDTIAPSDSASQVYSSSYGRGGGGNKPPKPVPDQPHPISYAFGNLNIGDNNKANQSASRQQSTSKDRHAPITKDDNKSTSRGGAKSTDRKGQLYDDTYFSSK